MDRVIVPCMTAGMGACRSLQDKGSCSRARQCGAAFFCQKSCSQRLFFIDQGETKQKRLCSVPVSASRVGVRVASACELRDLGWPHFQQCRDRSGPGAARACHGLSHGRCHLKPSDHKAPEHTVRDVTWRILRDLSRSTASFWPRGTL